jgi:hypothetical protein
MNCCNQSVEIRVDFNETRGSKISVRDSCEHSKHPSSSRHPTSNHRKREVHIIISYAEEVLLEGSGMILNGCCYSGEKYKRIKPISDGVQG